MDNNRNMIEQLKRDADTLRTKIEGQKTELNHLLGALAFYERQRQQPQQLSFVVSPHHGEELKLRGLTHKQAVVAIAKSNGGRIRSLDAKKLMIRAGIMSETPNASRMVHNAIKGSGLFVSISPGIYRLAENTPPSVSAIDPKFTDLASVKPVQ